MPANPENPDTLAFYAAQSTFSDPGALAPHYAGLPDDPAELARVARDLVIHRGEGEAFGYAIPQDRLHNDAETRYVDDILRVVVERNDAPLAQRRPLRDRFVGVCRDFALLHCSFLRHQGVPARLRSGFADYFRTDNFHCDHVVTEYWDEKRGTWLMADAQLAEPALLGDWDVDFDLMDVPRERFLVAGEAWRAVRERGADPHSFGLHPPEEGPFHGERFVAGNIRLDLAALNKVETLLWDVWGEEEDGQPGLPLSEASRALYDRVSLVAGDDVPFDAARRLFAQDDILRTPKTVRCMAPYNGTTQVTLR